MNKKLLITGSFLGILGIILGAWAAHGLEKLVDENAVKSFETGVRYQMYHSFLFLILGSTNFINLRAKKAVFFLVILGVFLFSGSIYGLSTNTIYSFNFKIFAILTPFGGLSLIIGWIVMLIGILKTKDDN
ncbi:DUF423 domain-containing protein [uncultured Winogradskyella sp.]|uniref:DUF423 domain-containing protein n=1 Tax=Winogradskyella sp. 4-2091 TaxID=3381659 RepID=UPI0026046DB8|nr:DUF423 domain-containing protein [uncultured Winogradskyella sp.]